MRALQDKLIPELNAPDFGLYDLTEREEELNQAYCRELERALLEYELNPRNFFRLNKAKFARLL